MGKVAACPIRVAEPVGFHGLRLPNNGDVDALGGVIEAGG